MRDANLHTFRFRKVARLWWDEPRPKVNLSGVWDDITTGIGNVVGKVAPAFMAMELGKLTAQAQGQALTVAGKTLYTTDNIAALQRQRDYETAQRGIEAARASNEIIPGVSPWLLLGGVAVLGTVAFIATRKG